MFHFLCFMFMFHFYLSFHVWLININKHKVFLPERGQPRDSFLPDCWKSPPNSMRKWKFSKFSPAAGSYSTIVQYTIINNSNTIIHFLNILKLLVQFLEKCSIFEKKSQIITIFACGGQFRRLFYALMTSTFAQLLEN